MVMNFALYDTNLHMIHHYKRVNSAKSVVNTSAPKTHNRKYVSSLNSRYSTPTLLSASSKNPSRANSNCEVRRKRINCLKNEAASSERSCSVPPRPKTRRNAVNIPLNYLTIDNSFPKINENRQKFTKNEASASGYTSKKKTANYNSGSSSSSVKSSPKHVKDKLIDPTKNTVKRPVPTPRVIVPEQKHIVPEDYEYVQFSLRITEDIIKNNLYSQKEMRRVFNSHVEANKGRLNMRKMLLQIDHLAKELNLSKKSLDRVSKVTSTDNMLSRNSKEQLMQKICNGHILTEEEIYGLNDEELEEALNTIINSCQCDHTHSEKDEIDIEVLKFKHICNCESEEMFKNISPSSSHDSYTPLQSKNNVKNIPVYETYRFQESPSESNNSRKKFTFTQQNIESSRESIISASNSVQKGDESWQNYEPDVIKANIEDFEKEIIEKCEKCRKRLEQLINKNKENIGKILNNCDSCKFILSQKIGNKENIPQEINENIQEREQIKSINSRQNTENMEVKGSDITVSSKSKESLSQITEKENVHETESSTIIESVISMRTENSEEIQQISKSKNSISKLELTEKSKSSENMEITEPDNNIPIDLERKSSIFDEKNTEEQTSTEPVLELKESSKELQQQQSRSKVDITDSMPQILKSKESLPESEHTEKSKSIENIAPTEQENNIPIEPGRICCKENQSKSVSVENISALIQQLKERSVDSIQEILQIKKRSQDSIQTIPKYGSNQQIDIEKDVIKEESQKCKSTCNETKSCEPEEKNDKLSDKTVSKKSVESEDVCLDIENLKPNDLYFFGSTSVKPAKVEEKVSIPLEKYSLVENTDDNVSRNELISSITKFILDRTFSKVSQEKSINENENKSDFVSVIEKAVNDQTNSLYDYYIPNKKFSSTSDFDGKVSLESLDKYQTNKTEYQKRETKRRKSSSSPSLSQNSSKTSSVSSFSKKLSQKPIKKLSKQSNILDHLEKYEQREESSKNLLRPCLCDYEMVKPYSGKLYENYIPKYSRSRFFPAVGTQTSNNNLLSDGEVDCFSSDGRTDESERSSY